MPQRVTTRLTLFIFMLILLPSSGCALHYFDAENGTEHIWGIGHMAMKPGTSNGGVQAAGHRADTVGVSIGKLRESFHLAFGWDGQQRLEIVDENTQLCLAWPRGSFYNARVGTEIPPHLSTCTNPAKDKIQ